MLLRNPYLLGLLVGAPILIAGYKNITRASTPDKTPTVCLFVSTTSDDSWSGRLPEPNQAKTDGPLATLDRARNEIRRIKQADGLPDGGVLVEILGGRYELAKPIELTVEGNVFHQVLRPVFLGGGRDNIVQNNVFVDCPKAMQAIADAILDAINNREREETEQ